MVSVSLFPTHQRCERGKLCGDSRIKGKKPPSFFTGRKGDLGEGE